MNIQKYIEFSLIVYCYIIIIEFGFLVEITNKSFRLANIATVV